MNKKLSEVLIPALVISLTSFAMFFVFTKIYFDEDESETNQIDPLIEINNEEQQSEIDSLKKVLNELVVQDSIQIAESEKTAQDLDNEIISYVSTVQNYMISESNKDLEKLKDYKKKLVEYFAIVGLTSNANNLLRSTIKSIKKEITCITSENKPPIIENDSTSNRSIIDSKIDSTGIKVPSP